MWLFCMYITNIPGAFLAGSEDKIAAAKGAKA